MNHEAVPRDPAEKSGGGATARDPVCGMTVRVDAPLRHEHAGRPYVFCGKGCLERFRGDPDRYLAPEPAPGVKEEPPAGAFTCPMHPEVVRSSPGACPLCGMALEPLVPGAGDAANPELADMTKR